MLRSMIIARRAPAQLAAVRFYTVIPSIPQAYQAHQQQPVRSEEEHPNPIHALYNTENQSMLDQHHYHTQTAVHSAEQTHLELGDALHSADNFSPTFNTVFDE